MKFKQLPAVFCVFLTLGNFGIWQTVDGECSTDNGMYSGKRSITNSGKACYPWRSNNKCFKGIIDVNSTYSHNYCRNPVDPSECHQDLPWCYTDQNNGNWEYCDLPQCGSEPPGNCSSPLGMGDGRISDDQIFAPSFMDQSSMAKYARLNQTNAKYWRASWRLSQYAYLSVNLRTPHFITKIHIQGTNGYFIERFKLLYSLDGYQWEYYTENKDDPNSAREFEGNHGGYDISIAYMKYPFIASRIAIIPVSFSNAPSLRTEIFGCSSPTNIPMVTEITSINSNTYWGLDRSPYVINAPITVPHGVLLTIEAGVKVIFAQATSSLTIQGCLELRGMKGLEVKFLTNNILSHMDIWANPFNDYESFWNGIFINPDSLGCKISPLKHVVIAGAGITTGINNIEFNNLRVSNSKIGLKFTGINENNVVRDCVFRQNLIGIEPSRVGSLSIESTQFIENEVGVKFTYITLQNKISSNFIFVDTLFRDNINGISILANCMNFTILRSNFSNHRDYAINVQLDCTTASFYSIVSCIFSSSSITTGTYYEESKFHGEYSLNILNSIVRDVMGDIGISINSDCKNLSISGSSFRNISDYSLHMKVDIKDSVIQINSSKFENNLGEDVIYFSGYQTSNIYLTGNTFFNNSVGNVLNFNLPSISNILLSKNIFKNFQAKYEISNNMIRDFDYSILASDNYWGVDDIDNISSRIYDFYRDSSKSIVDILTYFKDERFNEIVNSRNFQMWSKNNGTIGGRLDGNITLLSSSPSLTVTKSILIPKGMCLEMKGPMKIEFLSGRRILVEGGCLKAAGITLISPGSSWNGINFINSNGSHLSNISFIRTSLAFELVNSSLQVADSNINITQLALIRGLNYNMLDVQNSQIVCSEICIKVEDSVDMVMKIANSSLTSSYICIILDNIERLQFNLTETTLKSKYSDGYLLRFYSEIKNGLAEIFKSILAGNIKIDSGHVTFLIKESNFSSDSRCLGFEDWRGNPRKVAILNNVFRCSDYAIIYELINSSLIIADNKFIGGELQIFSRNPSTIIISNNYFNSVLRNDNSFLDLTLTKDNDLTFRNDEILIANNIYENVVGSGVSSVIKMSCLSYPYRRYLSAVYLRNNTFINNNVISTILTDCIGLTSEKNVLNNPNSLYEMKVLSSISDDVPQLMYFTRNFWGETVNDPNIRVYDETNDRTLMKVRVDPWYNDTTMTTLVFSSDGFIKPGGEIGGTLTQDVVLFIQENAYLVTEDITIPTDLKLTIKPGVQLDFVSGGINIQGTLIAKGNETNPITLNSRDANKKWKGLNFQTPISNSLKKLDFGWWQILYKGVWKTVSLYDNSYKKATADILCKQAGFKESISQTIFQCNSLSPDQRLKILPCNNISTPSVQIQCTQNNEFSLQECYISESEMTYTFFNITCLLDVTELENYFKIQTKSGKWISFNEKDNNLQLVNDLQNDEDGMFEQIFPCQSGRDDECFSVMPLKRPGWYLRFYDNKVIVDLASSNRNPSTFMADSSFVRMNKGSSEYSYIRMASQSMYLIEYNNSISTSALEPLDETDYAMYFFKIVNIYLPISRKKRDTEYSNESVESSILKKVIIINANTGIFVMGVPPKLEDIEITDSSSHGIHFRGYFSGETPITLNRSSISNSGGNAIYFDMIGDSRELRTLIEECELENCNQGCILWNGTGSLDISKSTFKNFKYSVYAYLNAGTSNITVSSSTFSSTASESVIVVINDYCKDCLIKVLENKFINISETRTNTNYLFFDFYNLTASFLGNIFDYINYNVLLDNHNGLSFSFENNVVNNSRFTELLKIYASSKFSIKNNIFMNNTYKVITSKMRTLTIDTNYDFKGIITNNSFFNPESEYEIFVSTNWDTSTYRVLDLSLNKWILGDYSRILSKIYCFYNDASKLPVNIWPAIYIENNSETLITRPTSDSTYFFNATGGEVTFSFTIPNTTSKYIFQNSLFIPANVTLSIESGTIIEFASGRGIVAYGVMEINSVDGQFINLTKTKKKKVPTATLR